MDTPVIDLTAAPDSPRRRNESAASSSSQEAPLVATSLTAARTAHSNDSRTVNAVAGGSGPSTRLPVLPARRRVPYPTNAASTPIDLTDDDIEYLGEHRLHLPDQPHVEGNDARPVAGDNYSLMGQSFLLNLSVLSSPNKKLTLLSYWYRPLEKRRWNAILQTCFLIILDNEQH